MPEVGGNMTINSVSITSVHASVGQLFPKSDAIKFLKVLKFFWCQIFIWCDCVTFGECWC